MKYIENDNAQILDALREVFGVKSDIALKDKLDISRSFISAIRNKRRNFSRPKMREIEKILKGSGIIVSSFIESIEELHDEENDSTIVDVAYQVSRIETLKEAKGRCELCSLDAPFRDKNNAPYLQVVYIIPSAYGGSYGESNLAALCPNCAAKLKVRADAHDIQFLVKLKSKGTT